MTETGFATANHIHNGYNVDENGVAQNGIGWVRSGQTGSAGQQRRWQPHPENYRPESVPLDQQQRLT